jgi:hypothetical protein
LLSFPSKLSTLFPESTRSPKAAVTAVVSIPFPRFD